MFWLKEGQNWLTEAEEDGIAELIWIARHYGKQNETYHSFIMIAEWVGMHI